MSGTVDRRIDARRMINHEFSSVEQFINEYVINLSRSGVFIKSDDPRYALTQVPGRGPSAAWVASRGRSNVSR